MSSTTDTRLYAAAIAVVSGVYSVSSALDEGMAGMPLSASLMLLVGAVAFVHGIVLLTPLAERLGALSGPLMIVWAAIMLANQLVTAMSDSVMGSWDGGMVALAVLMLTSGMIMSRHRRPM